MARIDIVEGPSAWHIMLAGFDATPAGAQGVRTLTFRLSTGDWLRLELLGVDWPRYPSPDPWTIRGWTLNIPDGYALPDGSIYGEVALQWHPHKRENPGAIELLRILQIADLQFFCSFPMRVNSVAASDNCRQHATTAVVEPTNHDEYFRCDRHRGLLRRGGERGEVVYAIMQREGEM